MSLWKKRLSVAATFGLSLCFVVACKTPHLSADFGKTYNAAFEKQRVGDEDVEAPALSATDAKQVEHVHYAGAAKKGSKKSGSTMLVTPMSMSVGSTGGSTSGSFQGSTCNITLQGK